MDKIIRQRDGIAIVETSAGYKISVFYNGMQHDFPGFYKRYGNAENKWWEILDEAHGNHTKVMRALR